MLRHVKKSVCVLFLLVQLLLLPIAQFSAVRKRIKSFTERQESLEGQPVRYDASTFTE
jgi:hypothetical protein